MATQRLQPRALCDAVADRIRDRVLAHEWRPGQELDEAALTQDYGVSRTPVREALKLLCHEGLLTAQARRGMTVTVVDPEELLEADELRRMLRQHAHQRHPGWIDVPTDSLVGRLLDIVERRIRLAQGPSGIGTPACARPGTADRVPEGAEP